MSLTRSQQRRVELMWQDKIHFNPNEDIIYRNDDTNTLVHIKPGSGSYLTNQMRQDGFIDYAKIAEYMIEDAELYLNQVEVLLLNETYMLLYKKDKEELKKQCLAELERIRNIIES